jgi:hypothetical protein
MGGASLSPSPTNNNQINKQGGFFNTLGVFVVIGTGIAGGNLLCEQLTRYIEDNGIWKPAEDDD